MFSDGGGAGSIEFVNFSRLTTMLLADFSIEVATKFENSAPGIVGGGRPLPETGLYVGFGW